MKIVFIGDNLSIHQKPLSDRLFSLLGKDYLFVGTKPIAQERINMGWSDYTKESLYAVYTTQENKKYIERKIDEADAVIIGAASTAWIRKRLKDGKLVFRYQERPFKRNKFFEWFNPKALVGIFRSSIIWQRKNYHLLAASAYAYNDFSRFFCFKNKAWKFGYFIEPIQTQFFCRDNNVVQVSWVGRLIKWKHCEMVIEAAKFLKDQGVAAHFNIIGQGPLEGSIISKIQDFGLKDNITLYRSKSNHDVREFLKNSDIHLITSDSNEGWGVVTNEAMSAGCCVISSKQTGAAPFLIQHKKNGLLFDVEKQDQLNNFLKEAVLDKNFRDILGSNAIKTMATTWSAQNAAEKLINLIKKLQQGISYNKALTYLQEPCSPAGIIKL